MHVVWLQVIIKEQILHPPDAPRPLKKEPPPPKEQIAILCVRLFRQLDQRLKPGVGPGIWQLCDKLVQLGPVVDDELPHARAGEVAVVEEEDHARTVGERAERDVERDREGHERAALERDVPRGESDEQDRRRARWRVADRELAERAVPDEEFIVKASGIERRYVMEKSGVLDPARMRPRLETRREDQLGIQAEMSMPALSRMTSSPAGLKTIIVG